MPVRLSFGEETSKKMYAEVKGGSRPAKASTRASAKPRRNGIGKKIADKSETVGFLLWDTRRAISRDFERLISPHGVSRSTFWILRILWQKDGLTQAQISQECRMRGPTIVGIVAQLEREKLVTRASDPNDSRKKVISLTARGRALKDVIVPIVLDVNRRALKGFSAAERLQLRDMLKRMKVNMEAD